MRAGVICCVSMLEAIQSGSQVHCLLHLIKNIQTLFDLNSMSLLIFEFLIAT